MRFKNPTAALLMTCVAGLSACAMPGSLPERRGSEVTVLAGAGLSQLNPGDVAVAPVVMQMPDATQRVLDSVPDVGLRAAMQRALVRRRYSPLSIDFVDSRLVNASYRPGAVGEEAVCEIVVHSWETRFWETDHALVVDVEVRMVDPTAPEGSTPLWAARMDGRVEANTVQHYTSDADMQASVLDEIALDLMARMPARDTSPARR